jgi:hypothetical protein
MTAKHEDILSNQNYIQQETVIDKLLQSLIASPIKYEDLLIGDKNAILIAARILGYGQIYNFDITLSNGKKDKVSLDLTTLKEKHPDADVFKNSREFNFTLPFKKNVITLKALNTRDEKLIDEELKGMKKISNEVSYEITTRLKHMIVAVDGKRETKDIRSFVDEELLARDSRALRTFYGEMVPDVKMEFDYEKNGYTEEGITVPITVDFFWPSE